jgi:hypothetical protein
VARLVLRLLGNRLPVFIGWLCFHCAALPAQTCPPDRIYAEGFDGVPVQHLVLSFTAQPSATPVGAVITPSVQVLVTDECGDPVGGRDVHVAIAPNPPNPAVLGGTIDMQSDGASGTASFGDLTLDYLGNGYTLTATTTGPGGAFGGVSDPFDVTRVGDPCLGPETPACAGLCADSDGDGLNDAWEIAGGIDFNGDGVIDAQHDLLLPDADPNVPDIYVQYDWMGYGLNDFGCTQSSQCTDLGVAHTMDTCSGPPVPGFAASCVQSCSTDSDCTSVAPSRIGDHCIAKLCRHTHDPAILAPTALDDVVESFAAHGIHLHILRGSEQPHSRIVSFEQPTAGCEGADVGPGVLDEYAVNLYDLKAISFDPRQALTHHYAFFGHYAACDSDAHCQACPAHDGAFPTFQATGIAELPGNDFIVSLGHAVNDVGVRTTFANVGGTFMHEFGHNLGLHHGGGSTAPGAACLPPDCEDIPNYKPNYLSIMNYNYQYNGIAVSAAIGSDSFVTCSDDSSCPTGTHCIASGSTCARLDYSNQVLPTGGNTPGALTENGELDETAGLGSGTSDIFKTDVGYGASCNVVQYFPSEGAVDWDNDGVAGDNAHATADLNENDHPDSVCTVADEVLNGHVDWGPAQGQAIFTYAFQCTPAAGDRPATSSAGVLASSTLLRNEPLAFAWTVNELTPELAARAHVAHPPRVVGLLLSAAARSSLASAAPGFVTVVLTGSADFDVAQVDRSSVSLYGARPVAFATSDANVDGFADLLLTFNRTDLRLSARATRLRLTGWMRNSQVFVADAQLR